MPLDTELRTAPGTINETKQKNLGIVDDDGLGLARGCVFMLPFAATFWLMIYLIVR